MVSQFFIDVRLNRVFSGKSTHKMTTVCIVTLEITFLHMCFYSHFYEMTRPNSLIVANDILIFKIYQQLEERERERKLI